MWLLCKIPRELSFQVGLLGLAYSSKDIFTASYTILNFAHPEAEEEEKHMSATSGVEAASCVYKSYAPRI